VSRANANANTGSRWADLKTRLREAGVSQSELARAAGLSRPALNTLINHGLLPARCDRRRVDQQISAFLRRQGSEAWTPETVTPPRCNAVAPSSQTESINPEEIAMLLRKQNVSPQARRHFGLTRDPFADPERPDEVYLSSEMRYVRECLYQVARHGGFVGLVGESGAGKTTLREELIDRLQRDDQSVIVIQPYVLAMEGKDSQGKTLKAQHIAEAIMSTVAPLSPMRSSPEARFRQLHESLRDSARAGHSHVLVIEEAHSMPTVTLKHLKRFRELKDGLRPLLSVILVGQPELAVKLSEHNPEVREVVQRIEMLHLPALDNDLSAYLTHRFKACGLAQVLDEGAIGALRTKLTPTRGGGSMLYPLAVHNALAAAMNRAADLGLPIVTADLVRGS
jgi:type II secretory pathway predicted ATPase ExeA/lambda repressor-like predicted transcriptional regulator